MSKESFSPSDFAIRGRIGGLVNASRHNSKEYTEPARKAWEKRFYDMVDPNNELPEEERQRRAEAVKRAYMNKLARKSAEARRK